MAFPLVPILYAAGGAAAGVGIGHLARGGKSTRQQVVGDAVLGALPVGLGLGGAVKLGKNVSKIRYYRRGVDTMADIPLVLMHPHSAAYIGPQVRAIASGYGAGIAVGHLSQRFVADMNKKSQSRGGEHTASSRTPGARKSMRGPSAQRKAYLVGTEGTRYAGKAISGHKLGTRGPCDKGYVFKKIGRKYMCVPRK